MKARIYRTSGRPVDFDPLEGFDPTLTERSGDVSSIDEFVALLECYGECRVIFEDKMMHIQICDT